jgi:hypothetical protein
MSKLRRFWNWLEPGLIYIDPMIVMAYCQLTAEMEMTSTGPAESDRSVRHSSVERYEFPRSLQADRS